MALIRPTVKTWRDLAERRLLSAATSPALHPYRLARDHVEQLHVSLDFLRKTHRRAQRHAHDICLEACMRDQHHADSHHAHDADCKANGRAERANGVRGGLARRDCLDGENVVDQLAREKWDNEA
jgi:hypothetical protein